VPSSYIPYEAAKIDVHRRIAAAHKPGELRELHDELRDRFGPPPESVEVLLAVQRARIELARDGASSLQMRGERIVVSGLDYESDRVGRLRERIAEAIYSSREATLSLRIDAEGDPAAAKIAALGELTDAISHSRDAAVAAAA
jgi:transcription-repair coupling factor (superfamily II helicase)